jgi:hypothetical protein
MPPCSQEFAVSSRARGTTVGRNAEAAFWFMIPATPATNATVTITARLARPVATTAAKPPKSAARARSAEAMMRNRSQRSASAPATSPSSSQDVYSAVCTRATCAGSWVSRAARSGIATKVTPSPAADTVEDVHSRQNGAPRSGAGSLTAVAGGGRGSR